MVEILKKNSRIQPFLVTGKLVKICRNGQIDVELSSGRIVRKFEITELPANLEPGQQVWLQILENNQAVIK